MVCNGGSTSNANEFVLIDNLQVVAEKGLRSVIEGEAA